MLGTYFFYQFHLTDMNYEITWFYFRFTSGFVTHMATQFNVPIPPNAYWYCTLANTILFSALLCSTLLIVSMTFDRFYSIILPHKAASFNTVKRTKITIIIIAVFSVFYNVPHLFISDHENWQCIPYGKAMDKSYGQVYYWFSFIINFALPFVLLLIMNSVIIHKIRTRCIMGNNRNTEDGATEGKNKVQQKAKMKNSEKQIFVILLLVTFGFLILTTPAYAFFLYVMFVDFYKTPLSFAGYYLFYSAAAKLHFTNCGMNFFLYVISGRKFRTDLVNLFRKRDRLYEPLTSSTSM